MRTHTIAALVIAACLPLAACSSSSSSKGGDGGQKPSASAEQKPSAKPSPKELALGKPADTVASDGTGKLEVTPTTVVYVKEGGGEEPENGTFAVVTVKDRAPGEAAAEAPPASGGGWKWIAPGGQSVDAGGGTSFNVVMDKFNAGGDVPAGSFVWNAVVFDLTTEQAKGGTLVYVDGAGTAHRWKAPAEDSGPQVAEVKKQLEG